MVSKHQQHRELLRHHQEGERHHQPGINAMPIVPHPRENVSIWESAGAQHALNFSHSHMGQLPLRTTRATGAILDGAGGFGVGVSNPSLVTGVVLKHQMLPGKRKESRVELGPWSLPSSSSLVPLAVASAAGTQEVQAGPWAWVPPQQSPPIRHWWATMHHKRSAQQQHSLHPSNPHHAHGGGVLNPELPYRPPTNTRQQQQQQQPQQCLRYLSHLLPVESPLHLHNGPDWVRRVCSRRDLDSRVRELLRANPCPQHQVCQVLSPRDLKGVASGDERECVETVERWWRTFHAIRKALVEFERIFTTRLDIGGFSVMHEVEQCKVRLKSSFAQGSLHVLIVCKRMLYLESSTYR